MAIARLVTRKTMDVPAMRKWLRIHNSRCSHPGCRGWLGLLLSLVVTAHGLQAKPIQQRLASGLIANADYHEGAPDKPAALILHGLLATHHFPTVQNIAQDLRDNDFTVLTPTLTLSVGNRTTSLPCTALQLHTMEQTVAELGWWINWLAEHGHRHIYLIGHSAGSLQTLIYSLGDRHPAVRGQILTSLVALEALPGEEPVGEPPERARERLAKGDHGIAKYDVSFCHGTFTAPPEVYLSYHNWNRQRVAEALRNTTLPVSVIMGGNDQRFTGTSWMPMLRDTGKPLVILEGASHFFDSPAEFDLLDSVQTALQAMAADEREAP